VAEIVVRPAAAELERPVPEVDKRLTAVRMELLGVAEEGLGGLCVAAIVGTLAPVEVQQSCPVAGCAVGSWHLRVPSPSLRGALVSVWRAD